MLTGPWFRIDIFGVSRKPNPSNGDWSKPQLCERACVCVQSFACTMLRRVSRNRAFCRSPDTPLVSESLQRSSCKHWHAQLNF
eukprot:10431858-Alexandrium_andersonii.AAC.1